MTMHDEPVSAQVATQTVGFLAAVATLSDSDVRAASRLPGWTRGHLLAHVTNQARALTGVLQAAAEGRVQSLYPSQPERNAAIDAGADRTAPEHLQALAASAGALVTAWEALPDDRLEVQFTAPAGWFQPARNALWFRWRELALHRLDLDVEQGLPPAGPLAGPLAARLVDDVVTGFAARSDVPALALTATDLNRTWGVGPTAGPGAEVAGPVAGLAAWLTGRSDGAGLASSGLLPALPAWA
jgi:maleylpyruvate isomerase